MKQLTSVLALMAAALFLTACGGDSHEEAVEGLADIMQEMVDVMKDVKDVDSAKAAGQEITEVSKRANELLKDMKEIEAPDEETAKAIKEKFEPRFKEIKKELMTEMGRIMQLGPEVIKALDEAAPEMEQIEPPSWMK